MRTARSKAVHRQRTMSGRRSGAEGGLIRTFYTFYAFYTFYTSTQPNRLGSFCATAQSRRTRSTRKTTVSLFIHSYKYTALRSEIDHKHGLNASQEDVLRRPSRRSLVLCRHGGAVGPSIDCARDPAMESGPDRSLPLTPRLSPFRCPMKLSFTHSYILPALEVTSCELIR